MAMGKRGMNISWGTIVMKISKGDEDCGVRVNGENVEEVKQMKYLRIKITMEGTSDSEAEIEHRSGAASEVFGAVRPEVLERRELSKETK